MQKKGVQPQVQARGSEAGGYGSGIAVEQAARALRKWVRETSADPQHALPGHIQLKPQQQ
jgi:hypothetical protein